MSPELAWSLPLAVALLAGLALVVCFPERCRTTAAAHRVLTVCGRWTLNLLLLAWILATWQRVTRNLGLAYTDKHAVRRTRTWNAQGVMTEKEHPRITYPPLIARPDAYGVVLTVWTRVGVGRAEWARAAEHLADVWHCRRVHVEQRAPGRLTVRGLRRDPLAASLSLHTHPARPMADPTTGDEDQEGDDDDAAPPGWAA